MGSSLVKDFSSKMTLEEFFAYSNTVECKMEFIGGCPIKLDAPLDLHQDIVEYLNELYVLYLIDKPCKVHFGRNVKLFVDSDDIRVPDLFILCDPSKEKGQWVEGAPDLVVEVWSKSNTKWERFRKISDYIKAGVKELITIDYLKEKIVVYNESNDADGDIYDYDSNIPSYLFKDFSWCLKDFKGRAAMELK